MKQARYKEPLPLAVIEAAHAGDAEAVERVLQYYSGYMDKPAFKQLQAQIVKRPPVESLRATGGCTLEIHRQVLKGRLRGQRADASTGHAEAFAADSCSDLLVFLLDMNNAPFVIDSVFISLSLIKGAYQSETGVILWFFDRLRKAPALLAPEPSLSLTSQVQRKF